MRRAPTSAVSTDELRDRQGQREHLRRFGRCGQAADTLPVCRQPLSPVPQASSGITSSSVSTRRVCARGCLNGATPRPMSSTPSTWNARPVISKTPARCARPARASTACSTWRSRSASAAATSLISEMRQVNVAGTVDAIAVGRRRRRAQGRRGRERACRGCQPPAGAARRARELDPARLRSAVRHHPARGRNRRSGHVAARFRRRLRVPRLYVRSRRSGGRARQQAPPGAAVRQAAVLPARRVQLHRRAGFRGRHGARRRAGASRGTLSADGRECHRRRAAATGRRHCGRARAAVEAAAWCWCGAWWT